VKPIVELLEHHNSDLKLEIRTPIKFDDEVRQLYKSKYDGILLDLRLDRNADSTGARVNYRALSLAQELRTRMTEGQMTPCPLILWSVDGNFKLSYNRDETGHDLFDHKYSKTSVTDTGERMALELVDLAKGYRTINTMRSKKVKDIYSRLIDLPDAFNTIDPRIANDIADDSSHPSHMFARSVLQNLIYGNGPLIDEQLLAARLGVDIAASADWSKLKEKVKDARYTGIFGSAWPRWWMFKISTFWKEISPSAPLQRLEAEERTATLKKALNLSKLKAAKPLEHNYDARFWHVCKLLNMPISPANAVQLSVERREWQDGVYASVKSILDRKHKSAGYEIHPFERQRISEIVAALRNEKET
jgi:hypothetical protein